MWRPGPDRGVEVLVVHRPRYGDWSFPKGKRDPGETDQECALREVEEETGYRCALGAELPGSKYLDRGGRPKEVRYWAMTVVSGSLTPMAAEVDQACWLGGEAAASLLTYDRDRVVLDGLQSC